MKKLLLILVLCLVGCNDNTINEVNNLIKNPQNKIVEVNDPSVQITDPLETTEEFSDPTDLEVFDGTSYDILFSSERGGDRDLYLMNGDGSNQNPILDLDSIEGHGDFAPDGYTIVFFSTMDGDRELYTIDIRNPNQSLKRLTYSEGDDHLPDFSPDGTMIVFESSRDGNFEIYLMNADGTDQVRLTTNTVKDKQPKFSPDGQTIAYTTFKGGVQHLALISLSDIKKEPRVLETKHVGYIDFYDNEHIICHGSNSGRVELFTMDITTGLKESFMTDTKTLWIPVYSPDKKWVLFNKEAGFKTGDLFINNLTDGSTHQLTDDPKSDWGPDFRPIPVQYKVYFDSNIDGDRDIYEFDTYTKELSNLTNNDDEDGIPYLSPDQTEIVFFSDRDGDDEIYTMDLDGNHVMQLTFNDKKDRAATWSHNGDAIAFSSDRDGDLEIFIMNRDGSHQTQLTDNNTKDFWPVFSTDDKTLSYTYFDTTQDTYHINIKDWLNKSDFESELLLENCSRCSYSPDGNKIVYSSKENGTWQITLYDFKTDETTLLTSNSYADWVPTWIDDDNVIFSRESGYKASLVLYNISNQYETILIGANAQNWRPTAVPYHLD
ncbi:MAG: PD40 domain-containing protein [Clostridiales bacterium]|nr:PD40 domain-containing protein [Clostridiales bacterium]